MLSAKLFLLSEPSAIHVTVAFEEDHRKILFLKLAESNAFRSPNRRNAGVGEPFRYTQRVETTKPK